MKRVSKDKHDREEREGGDRDKWEIRVGTKTRRKFKERGLIKRSFVNACHKAHSRRHCVYLQTPQWKEQYVLERVNTAEKFSKREVRVNDSNCATILFSSKEVVLTRWISLIGIKR